MLIKKRHAIIIIAIVLIISTAAIVLFGSEQVNSEQIELGDINYADQNFGIYQDAEAGLYQYRNIAVFGVDSSVNKTITILSQNRESGKVKLYSIGADTLVVEPDGKTIELGNVYAKGGYYDSIKVLNQNFDLNVRESMVFSWECISELVEELGGLEINKKQMDGDRVAEYAIYGEHMKEILTAIFDKVGKMPQEKANELFEKSVNKIDTNMGRNTLTSTVYDVSKTGISASYSYTGDIKDIHIQLFPDEQNYKISMAAWTLKDLAEKQEMAN